MTHFTPTSSWKMNAMKFKSLTLAAGIALSPLAASAETVLKMAAVAPSGSPWGKWGTAVAAKVEEVSGGELKIELLFDAQAGDEQTILRQTMKGRLDIAFVSNAPLTLISEELAIPSSPYLFESTEQGSCVAHQHMAEVLGEMMDSAGVVPLTWMEVGHNVLFSKDPVKVPSDLNGKKVRIAPTIADVALTNAIGASGVPMGTTDAIPALQTGSVDAAVFPTVFGIAIGTHKVAPNVIVTNHSRLIGTVAVSKRVWSKLSAQEQQWLSAVFSGAGPQLTDIILGAEKALLGQIEDAGIPVHYLSEEELAAWKAAAADVPAAVAAEAGGNAETLVDALSAAKTACGS
ncbi:TRAP transporter substrate-binding protein [Tropicibacter sp. R16_0]|uniref:TRAP transporter substrate-binding protein n=1 Tax=Tropicibacter sp. R16_0 TaxID=2821102 RepID=UPI001ADCDCB6|nr:TRAP transporter substrate-binding protein DctP [Tropicibacter sp. R16_0]MBO9452970.1 TRAP transporter substrate-binding protein [Tropicibacter sp. R16_0]